MKKPFIVSLLSTALVVAACTSNKSEDTDGNAGAGTGGANGGAGGGSSGSTSGGAAGNSNPGGGAGEAGSPAEGGASGEGGGSGGAGVSGEAGASGEGGAGGCGTPTSTPLTCESIQPNTFWRLATERVEIPLVNFAAPFVSATYEISPAGLTGTASIEGDNLVIEVPVSQVGIMFFITSLTLTDECGNTWVFGEGGTSALVFVTDSGDDSAAICG